jgi:anti-sigma regulatory factor (Ser/Thr protein kinase)
MHRTIEHAPTRMSTVPLPSDPAAPAAARTAVAEFAGDLPQPIVERLTLVASELVTNAVRHAVAVDPSPILTLGVTPDCATLSVHDSGSSFDVDALNVQPGRAGGWGLMLVDSLVDRWRIELSHGTRVVCEIDRP